jgi:hypothetical protein
MARSVRFNPETVEAQDLPGLSNLTEDKAARKIESIREGGSLQREFPAFGGSRPCQDCCWVILFLLVVGATLGLGIWNSATVFEAATQAGRGTNETTVVGDRQDADGTQFQVQDDRLTNDPNDAEVTMPNLWVLAVAGTTGVVASLVAASAMVMMAHQCPACVVYTSLFFGPVMSILSGISLIVASQSFPGGGGSSTIALLSGCLMIFLGVCMGCCTFCCWRHLIPFMIKLVEVVSEVVDQHRCMIAVAVFGAILSSLWTIACFLCFIGVGMANEIQNETNKTVLYIFVGVCTLVYVWGAQVCTNICHVTYSGVFGRWYYGLDKTGSVLAPSFKAAMTTSLGSICLGSFLVALVRSAEAIARSAKNDAAADGNWVCCIIACCLECIIGCIGDILEYFNEWAYVQCAFRGVKFCDAARITYSMFTCANLQYILSDLLLGNVAGLGALLCGVVGAAVGGVTGYFLEPSWAFMAACWCAAFGLFAGCVAGAAAMSILSSGIKAILAAWADNPQPLMESHPEVHDEFQHRIGDKLSGEAFS